MPRRIMKRTRAKKQNKIPPVRSFTHTRGTGKYSVVGLTRNQVLKSVDRADKVPGILMRKPTMRTHKVKSG